MSRTIELVGPKGYIHNWVFVGAPGVGAKVSHPKLGSGTVTSHDGSHATVRFHKSGASKSFEVKAGKAGVAAKLAPRPGSSAPDLSTREGRAAVAARADLGTAAGRAQVAKAQRASERASGPSASQMAANAAAMRGSKAKSPASQAHADWIKVGNWQHSTDSQTGSKTASLGRTADFSATVKERHATGAAWNSKAKQYDWHVTRQRTEREGPDARGSHWAGNLDSGTEPTMAKAISQATKSMKQQRAAHIAAGGDVGYGDAPTGDQIRAATAGSSKSLARPPGRAVNLAGERVKTPAPERAAGRRKLAGQQQALPDGSFIVPNVDYLKKAIRSVGRAPASKRPALGALIRKRARELKAANAPGVKGTWAFQGASDNAKVIEMAAARRMPKVRGAADVQMSRSGPGTITVQHKSTGMKVGTLAAKGRGYQGTHATGVKAPASGSQQGALAGLIAVHNRLAAGSKSGNAMVPAQQMGSAVAASSDGEHAVSLAGSLPVTSNASSSDGPRVTTMGAGKAAGGGGPSGLSPYAQSVYKKLIAKGMKPAQAEALAKRAAAMHDKAAKAA